LTIILGVQLKTGNTGGKHNGGNGHSDYNSNQRESILLAHGPEYTGFTLQNEGFGNEWCLLADRRSNEKKRLKKDGG